MPLRLGQLRHRIEIQENRTTRNDLGETVPGWVTIKRRWADVQQLTGNEAVTARAINATASVQVRLWWVKGLTPAHRVKCGSRILEVLAVTNPDGIEREALLICRENVNGK